MWEAMKKAVINIKVVDLFCGCGGMSLGFQNAGFDIVASFDYWEPAVSIYKVNFSHPVFQKDLMDSDSVEEIRRYSPQMIIGGPPCQDFSISGKRDFVGKRANLTTRFAEIVSAIKPEWFVMENVYNIEKSPVLPVAIEKLHKYPANQQVQKKSDHQFNHALRCGHHTVSNSLDIKKVLIGESVVAKFLK